MIYKAKRNIVIKKIKYFHLIMIKNHQIFMKNQFVKSVQNMRYKLQQHLYRQKEKYKRIVLINRIRKY
jgi:hypothetical protein